MEDAPQEDFAFRLRQLMEEQSITQVDVGRVAGVTQGAVSLWLKGMQPNKSRVRRIAIHYDLNETWLLTGRGQKMLSLTERFARDEAKSRQTEDAQK